MHATGVEMCRMARAEATTAPPPTTTTTTTVNTNQTAEHKLHNTHYYLFLPFTVIINVRVSAISPVLSVSPVLSILCKINLASMPQLTFGRITNVPNLKLEAEVAKFENSVE